MNIVSFNALRTIGMPSVTYIKPDLMYKEIERIKDADLVLFPETWQVPALVFGLKKNIFPSIETMQLGANKIEMTRALWSVAKEYVPYTEILESTESNIQAILTTFPFPFVAKEAKNSMGKGVFLIESEEALREYASKNDVLYIQEYLINDGKDLRVCVVGDEIYAAYWRVGIEGEFLHNISQGGSVCSQFIPEDALKLVITIARALNINHAGFDIIVSEGRFYILEFNVLFGNQGLNRKDATVAQSIYAYISSHFSPSNPTPTTPGKIIS
ncbi:ATP-grasp domain-containing protein [Gracilibacillus kekensis]|uniref:Ribosomal protein S6--L-glutamate ligase n=1 Tax=Gracilibacillus kekensis TaxID=1027249 RepID=A0A1M7IHL6_9BACI|nr:alpha-L-glutamate ligase [Gracilibacillus kekensis]SHM40336.1 ribosomal protein S6--L-glutamate ligase [Gracilibacillus kekensis]